MLHNWVRKKRSGSVGVKRRGVAVRCRCRNITPHHALLSDGCRKAFDGK